jgi:hypothetical protein
MKTMNCYVYWLFSLLPRATMKFHENMNRNIAEWWKRFHGIDEYSFVRYDALSCHVRPIRLKHIEQCDSWASFMKFHIWYFC